MMSEMGREFKIRYRRKDKRLWKTEKIVGLMRDISSGRMNMYHKDGTIHEIPDWKEYESILGPDWVLAQKENMEKEAGGQSVPLKVGNG